ncbi:MAG: zinc-ribbon domain-containing protein [Myxococcales bacterium]|nr:zinc-ribbon domain-containing protein [Myxococcales bacterium]MCB9520960.1 zinc-ribbon domain-containing protein [Myxococcales bacterium]MCB9532627.1 zinc-ribbon domain-containing protein [Myxococcales bacterium]
MKIECPHCGTAGKLDESKLPEGGANIRCPACKQVFLVAPPSAVAEGPAAAPVESPGPTTTDNAARDTAAAAPSGDSPDPSRPRGLTSSRFSVTSSMPSLDPALLSAARAASGASDSGRQGIAVPGIERGERGGVRVTGRHLPPTVRPSGGQPIAEPLAAASSQDTGSLPSATPPSQARVRPRGPWKVRAAGAMIYDFTDLDSLRAWLETRTSFDDLEASADGGDTFEPVASIDELASVRAQGYSSRTRRTAALQSGARPAQLAAAAAAAADVAPAPPPPAPNEYTSEAAQAAARAAVTTGRASPVTTTGRTSPVKSKSTKEKEPSKELVPKRTRLLLGLLVLIGAAAGGYHVLTQPPKIPDTPAGHQLAWVIEVLNDETRHVTVSELEQHFAPSVFAEVEAPALLHELEYWQGRHAEYRFDGVQGRSTATNLSGRVVTPSMDTGLIVITVEPEGAQRMTEWRIVPAGN